MTQSSSPGRWAWRGRQTRTARYSQFFICLAPAPWLDGQYTIVGQVVSGMDYVDDIKKGSGQSGSVTDPDRIIHMTVAQ